MRWFRSQYVLLLTISIAVVLTACTPAHDSFAKRNGKGYPGFFSGFGDGLLIVWNFVVSWVDPHFGIYRVRNTGLPYNGGFVIGVLLMCAILSSLSHRPWRWRR